MLGRRGTGTLGTQQVPWGPWGSSTQGKQTLCVKQEKIPFAVVGADQEHQVNGKRVLGRKTKWGIIEGEQSPSHPQPSAGAGSSTHGCVLAWGVLSHGMELCCAPVVPSGTQSVLPRHPSTVEPSCQPCPSALLCSGEPGTLRVPPPAGPANPVSGDRVGSAGTPQGDSRVGGTVI